MGTISIVLLVGVAVIIAGWVMSVQRRLVVLDENVNNSLAQIDVNLMSRFDALTGLLDLIKGYNEHEYKTLTDIIGMRASGHTAKDINENENVVTQALGKIIATAEAYPDLKASQQYQTMMDSVNDYENKVRITRQVCNDSITKFNREIKVIPTCFVAGMLGFTTKEYLKIEDRKKEMPSLK